MDSTFLGQIRLKEDARTGKVYRKFLFGAEHPIIEKSGQQNQSIKGSI